MVAGETPGDRPRLRTRGLRPRARRRTQGGLERGRDREDDGRRPAGRSPTRDRARRQLRLSLDRGGRRDGGRAARARQGAGSGPDHVRLGQHARRAGAALPGLPGTKGSTLPESARRRGLGLRVTQPLQHPGRQRGRPDRGHHRAHQPGQAPHARTVGRAPRLGLGSSARARLPRDPARGRRQARGHRRSLALRQGRSRHHGLRAALRGRARRIVRRRGRQAAPPQLRRGGREPHWFRCLPLDGRQLPQVRRRRVVLRQQERERHSGRRSRADRPVRTAPCLHQLRGPRERRRQVA